MENKLKIANDKHKTKYIFFWGNHSNKPYITKACLSQWWECAFNINGVFAQDAAIYLDKYNICVRAGNHCAKMLDNVFNISNTVRISLSFYNTKEEVDLLINVLKNSNNIWKEIL